MDPFETLLGEGAEWKPEVVAKCDDVFIHYVEFGRHVRRGLRLRLPARGDPVDLRVQLVLGGLELGDLDFVVLLQGVAAEASFDDGAECFEARDEQLPLGRDNLLQLLDIVEEGVGTAALHVALFPLVVLDVDVEFGEHPVHQAGPEQLQQLQQLVDAELQVQRRRDKHQQDGGVIRGVADEGRRHAALEVLAVRPDPAPSALLLGRGVHLGQGVDPLVAAEHVLARPGDLLSLAERAGKGAAALH